MGRFKLKKLTIEWLPARASKRARPRRLWRWSGHRFRASENKTLARFIWPACAFTKNSYSRNASQNLTLKRTNWNVCSSKIRLLLHVKFSSLDGLSQTILTHITRKLEMALSWDKGIVYTIIELLSCTWEAARIFTCDLWCLDTNIQAYADKDQKMKFLIW